MKIDISRFNSVADYDLVLCKPNEEKIISLNRKIINLKYIGGFLGTDEVTFSIPYYLNNDDMEDREKNPVYDLIKGDYLVNIKNLFIPEDEYKVFIVKQVTESVDEDKNIYKDVLLYSRENQLTDKRLVDYSGESRMIYDPYNEVDENGLEIGFLNYIINRTSWNIGTVSSDFSTKYRAISLNNTSMLKAMQDVAKSFDCVYTFDTKNKLINVHTISEIGSYNDAYLTDRNFITSLKKDINTEDIKTRLYLYGDNKISIQQINPLGQPYIDNFNFYKNTDYMTQELIDALNNFEDFYDSKTGEFEDAWKEINRLNMEISKQEIPLFNLETELIQLKDKSDLYMVDDVEKYKAISVEIENKEAEIQNVKTAIDELVTQRDAQFNIVNSIRESMKKENFFTADDMKLLDSFIKEETYSNSDYVEELLPELLEYGVKTLNRISTPAINFDIDVIDFLTLLEYQLEWKKFNLGDLVRVANDELNFNMLVRFVGYEHDYDNNRLTLKFTNKDSLEDKSFYLEELLSEMKTTSASVDWNKLDWAKGKDAQRTIEEYIKGNLDIAKQKIVSGENQKAVIDQRGIWLAKENENGSIDPNQIRMVNNVIALTNDNWESVEVAISPENGINANLIRGVLGEFAYVNANQIRVGDDFYSNSELGTAINTRVEKTEQGIQDLKDKSVLQYESYNSVVISPEKGIQVFDDQGRERVQIGNWASGRYGLKLTDASGSRTILDDQGMLQSWQQGNIGNASNAYPLELYLYVPAETQTVYNCILRFKKSGFRTYSKSTYSSPTNTATDKGFYRAPTIQSTQGGGDAELSTESIYYSYSSPTTADGEVYVRSQTVDYWEGYSEFQGRAGHNHGLPHGTAIKDTSGLVHLFAESGNHTHDLYIPEHNHRIDTYYLQHHHIIHPRPHYHSILSSELAHTHDIEIPSHTHPMNHEVYVNSLVTNNMTINVGGTNVWSGSSISESSIDIGKYLTKGGWNVIKFIPQAKTSTWYNSGAKIYETIDNSVCSIEATVFLQVFLNI